MNFQSTSKTPSCNDIAVRCSEREGTVITNLCSYILWEPPRLRNMPGG